MQQNTTHFVATTLTAIMSDLPTLIILAQLADSQRESGHTRQDSPSDMAMRQFNALSHTLRKGLDSGLPVVLVTQAELADQARQLLRADDVVTLPDAPMGEAVAPLARAVSAGVVASAHAPGWLLLPVDMTMLKATTLTQLGQALGHHPMVFPQYRQQPGHPAGFSAEFFSELIRLNHTRSLSRLMARYPSVAIEVDDPGVLLGHGDHQNDEPRLARSDGSLSWSTWQ